MPDRNRHPLATLIQAQYAAFGLATAAISTADEYSPLRHVITGHGWFGTSLMATLALFSLLSLSDVVANHHRVRRVVWLAKSRHWFMVGQISCWLSVAFVAIPRFDAIGLSTIFAIGSVFLGWFLFYEARTRRAACARDPSAC